MQVAEADNGPADREVGQRQKLLRDERKDNGKDDDRKTKEESTKAANELLGTHMPQIAAIGEPARVGNFIDRIHIHRRLGMPSNRSKPPRNVQVLFSFFENLFAEKIIVKIRAAFFRFRNVLHIEVQPQNIHRCVNFEMDRDSGRGRSDKQENPFRPESHQSPKKSD